jgi:hypothetical protein
MEIKDQEVFNKRVQKEKKKWKGIIIMAAVTILIGIVLVVSDAEGQYKGRCNHYRDGYKDGWCSMQEYGCIPPGFYPVCYALDYDSNREAYHVGFRHGERDYR